MSAIYLDSWWEPSAAKIAWAKARGYAGWLGYFAESGTDRIYHGWSDATFLAVKAAGLFTADFDSGYDDPAWVRDRNSRLGIIGILDCEGSIRPDGAWVDPWMDIAGPAERFYGTSTTISNHSRHGHPGYIEAGYPSNSGTSNPYDPGLVWTVSLPSPARPIGRQYAGSVPLSIGSVDFSHFDPTFFSTGPPSPPPPPAPILITGDDSMAASFTTADGGQQVQFYADAKTGHIYEIWYTTHDQGWHGPVDCTAEWKTVPASGGLSAHGDAQNDQFVYWTGTDGHRWEMWYANNKWNGPLHIQGT